MVQEAARLRTECLELEKHIKDLRGRAKKVCELEKANKKLERELKEQKVTRAKMDHL